MPTNILIENQLIVRFAKTFFSQARNAVPELAPNAQPAKGEHLKMERDKAVAFSRHYIKWNSPYFPVRGCFHPKRR
jgi:hypothetical protein